mmetsp:Transcript_14812/g.17243  ORF Transcript_14812/g.17243 Transcript_14812/m.17243 type:complete len:405 (-) Transcript_14812:539-1753(-)
MLKNLIKLKKSQTDDESCEMSSGLSDGSGPKKQDSGEMDIDTDVRNAEIVFDAFHHDPFEVMRLQTYDDAPMAKGQDEVVIRIEASTVSSIDCQIRNGTYPWKFGQKPPFPIVPGVDCVGVVVSCGSLAGKSGIEPGDRVASFLMHGCNAKYIVAKFYDLVRVPENVDPFQAVALIRTYTAAFQALMGGIHGHGRYSRKPLFQKKVLVVGPCGTFERALVELSIFLGAKRVYFSAHSSNQSHDMYIRLLGAKPLSDDPEEWSDTIQGKIDIAIDSICIDRYEHTYSTLDEDGILVAAGMQEIERGDDLVSNIEKIWTRTTIAVDAHCTYYHGFVHTWEKNRKQCMKDIIYLFNLLEKGKIKPKIASRIPLVKIAAAQEQLEQNIESVERRGIIVVDPWLCCRRS